MRRHAAPGRLLPALLVAAAALLILVLAVLSGGRHLPAGPAAPAWHAVAGTGAVPQHDDAGAGYGDLPDLERLAAHRGAPGSTHPTPPVTPTDIPRAWAPPRPETAPGSVDGAGPGLDTTVTTQGRAPPSAGR